MTQIHIEDIAKAARLALRDDEKEGLSQDVAAILSLGELLLEDGEGAFSLGDTQEVARGNTSALRADEPKESLSQECLLSLAPTSCDGYVTVPRVISDEPMGGDGT